VTPYKNTKISSNNFFLNLFGLLALFQAAQNSFKFLAFLKEMKTV